MICQIISKFSIFIIAIVAIYIFSKIKNIKALEILYSCSSFLLVVTQMILWASFDKINIPNSISVDTLSEINKLMLELQDYLRDLVLCNLIFLSVMFTSYLKLSKNGKFYFFMLSALQVAVLMTAVDLKNISSDLKVIFNMLYLVIPAVIMRELPKLSGGLRKKNVKRIINIIKKLE